MFSKLTTLPGLNSNKDSQVRLSIHIPMVILVAILIVFGMLTAYSASWVASIKQFSDVNRYFMRQLLWLGLGMTGAVILFLIDYHRLEKNYFSLYAVFGALFLLIVGFLFGDDNRNIIKGISIQPSELAKLAIVLYLGVWLYAKGDKLKQAGFGIIPLALILGLVGGLIAVQPDVSAAATVFFLGLLMFFLAGGSLWQIIVFCIVADSLGSALITVIKPNALDRIRDFILGIIDLANAPDQVGAAISAFQEGGWFGVGPGRGIAKLFLIPVPHTDSIFAVIGEEMGVFGASLLVILYGLFLWRGLVIAREAVDGLGSLLAAGLTFWIVFEAYVNMAAMIGFLPVAGNPLPFISLGGSNMVVTLAAVGIILNVGRFSQKERDLLERRAFSETPVDLRGRNGRRRVSRSNRSESR